MGPRHTCFFRCEFFFSQVRTGSLGCRVTAFRDDLPLSLPVPGTWRPLVLQREPRLCALPSPASSRRGAGESNPRPQRRSAAGRYRPLEATVSPPPPPARRSATRRPPLRARPRRPAGSPGRDLSVLPAASHPPPPRGGHSPSSPPWPRRLAAALRCRPHRPPSRMPPK